MFLRFPIAVCETDEQPLVCGQSNPITANLAIEIYVDNDLIGSSADASLGITPAVTFPCTTTNNGIIVSSLSIENSTYFKVGIDLPNIFDSTTVRVVVSKTDFYTLDKTIIVYGYDTGNNPLAGITHNQNLQFVLISTLPDVTVDNCQVQARSDVYGWRRPFTNALRLYLTNSSRNPKVFYKQDGIELGNSKDIYLPCNTGLNITQRVQQHDCHPNPCSCGCGDTEMLDACESTITVDKLNLIPEYDFAIGCDDCCDCEEECTIDLEGNYIEPNIDVSEITALFVDDVEVVSINTIFIKYQIYDCNNQLVEESEPVEVDLTEPFDSIANRFDIGILLKGTYTVRFTIYGEYLDEDDNAHRIFECSKDKVINTCHYYTFEKTACNKYKVFNYRNDTLVTLTVDKLTDSKQFENLSSNNIGSCGNIEVTLEDGVYRFGISNGIDTEYFIVVVACAIENCWIKHFQRLACINKPSCKCGGKCNGGCAGLPTEMYNFNAFSTLAYGYFNMINSEYLNNYIYTAIDPNKIDELFQIHTILKRALEYCPECKQVTETVGHIQVNTKNCKCG